MINQPNKAQPSADRDATSEELASRVPAEQSDDLFTDRSAQNVSNKGNEVTGENKVATSIDDE